MSRVAWIVTWVTVASCVVGALIAHLQINNTVETFFRYLATGGLAIFVGLFIYDLAKGCGRWRV